MFLVRILRKLELGFSNDNPAENVSVTAIQKCAIATHFGCTIELPYAITQCDLSITYVIVNILTCVCLQYNFFSVVPLSKAVLP